ncbi:MAG TPA: enoyl-CoA hydratase/isomerase family protein [Streptosporangiaceae bacterium]|nr:enoyl-CoA hydratase/isomerase family protein [Streptosporangiaceae bacterium]
MEESNVAGTSSVLARRHGRVGWIRLNRPEAINALDLPVIRAVTHHLRRWQDDPDIALIVLDGAGERGFCAGGDIRAVRESAYGDPTLAATLWREEYELDALIAHYPHPVAVVMDGITMGGGVGLGAHASLRIVTERTVMAMPEVMIGLAPDVGSSLLLARAPGETGTHLALTAARIGPHDAVACGLADHVVATSRIPDLIDALAGPARPADLPALHALLAREATGPADRPGAAGPPAELIAQRPWIDACYRAGTVEEILAALRARPEPAASCAAAAIESASPTALKVTLRALRNARAMTTVDECLIQDYRVSLRFLHHHDLSEGIRAAVVDKDRAPQWKPASLAEVSPDVVDRYFAPLGPGDLRLPPAQPPEAAREKLGADPGLCGECRHASLNQTRRGPAYLRCTRATWDSRLPRYPASRPVTARASSPAK